MQLSICEKFSWHVHVRGVALRNQLPESSRLAFVALRKCKECIGASINLQMFDMLHQREVTRPQSFHVLNSANSEELSEEVQLFKRSRTCLVTRAMTGGIIRASQFLTLLLSVYVSAAPIPRLSASVSFPRSSLRDFGIGHAQQSVLPLRVKSTSYGTLFTSATTKYEPAGNSTVTTDFGQTKLLSFSFNITAIPAKALAQNDTELLTNIPKDKQYQYEDLRADYDDGLRLPFLSWCGVVMSSSGPAMYVGDQGTTSIRTSEEMGAARAILENSKPKRLTVRGRRAFVSQGSAPQTFSAYVKLAEIKLRSGDTILIISSSRHDVEFRSSTSQDGSGAVQKEYGADSYEIMQNISI